MSSYFENKFLKDRNVRFLWLAIIVGLVLAGFIYIIEMRERGVIDKRYNNLVKIIDDQERMDEKNIPPRDWEDHMLVKDNRVDSVYTECNLYTYQGDEINGSTPYIPTTIKIGNKYKPSGDFSPDKGVSRVSSNILCKRDDQLFLRYYSRKCISEKGCVTESGETIEENEEELFLAECSSRCSFTDTVSILVGKPGSKPYTAEGASDFLCMTVDEMKKEDKDKSLYNIRWGKCDASNNRQKFLLYYEKSSKGDYQPGYGIYGRFNHWQDANPDINYEIFVYRGELGSGEIIFNDADILPGDRLVVGVSDSSKEKHFIFASPSRISSEDESSKFDNTFSTISLSQDAEEINSVKKYLDITTRKQHFMLDGESAMTSGAGDYVKLIPQSLISEGGRSISHQIVSMSIINLYQTTANSEYDVNIPFYIWPGDS